MKPKSKEEIEAENAFGGMLSKSERSKEAAKSMVTGALHAMIKDKKALTVVVSTGAILLRGVVALVGDVYNIITYIF